MPATNTTPQPTKAPADRARAAVERTTELSEDVLESIETSQRNAIEAVRKFVEKVDQSLPPGGDGHSRRQEIVDSALEMADKLVHVEYDFLRKVVHSAGDTLTRADGKAE